jgi:hypothetical protein
MRIKTSWILLALPTIVAGVILIVLLNWHLPTRIKVTLKTERTVFKIGGEDKSTILDSVGLRSIIIEKFDNVKLKPESLELFTPTKDSNSILHPRGGSSGSLIIKQQPVVITGKNGRSQSNVSLSGAEGGQRGLLAMDSVSAKPSSEVTLENTDDPNDLIVHVNGQQSSGRITVAEPIKLAIDQCEVAGVVGDLNLDEPLTLRAKLLRDSSIEFNSQRDSLILTITVPNEKATNLFPQGRIPVTAIKFERLDGQTGRITSSLLRGSNCEIIYPDYQDKIDKVTINSPDFLSVDYLQNFNIEEITYNPEEKGVSMVLQGVADKVTSGSAEYYKDHRLTIYNALWHNYKVVALFAVLCWVAGTTAGFYKFFKEKK